MSKNHDSRLGNYPPPCDFHAWQPISFRFEQQMLDAEGPDPECGRVYVVCMGCHRHTYIETRWAGRHAPMPATMKGKK